MTDATPVRSAAPVAADKTPMQGSAKKVAVKKFTTLSPYGRRGNILAYRSNNLERTPVVYNPLRTATFDPSPSPQQRRGQQHAMMYGVSGFQQPLFEDEVAASNPAAVAALPVTQQFMNPYDWSAQYSMVQQSYHKAAAQFGFVPFGAYAATNNAHQQPRHSSQARSSAPSMGGVSVGNSASATCSTIPVLPLQDLLNEYGRQLDFQQRCAESGATEEESDEMYRPTLSEWATTQHGRMVLQGLLTHEPFECVDEGDDEGDDGEPADPLNATQMLPCSINGSTDSAVVAEEVAETAAPAGTISSLQIAREILEHLTLNMEIACLDDCGCNVIRALVEHALVTEDDMTMFLTSVNETLLINMCTLSQETRRVPQLLFEKHNNGPLGAALQPLVVQFANHAVYLSATQQGCIGYMRVYEACRPEQKSLMLHPLVNLFADLSCDPYGNYVVQCIVQHSEPHAAAQLILASFPTQCLRLSCNKYASNVMEKVIRKLSLNIPPVRRMVMDELVMGVGAPRADPTGKQNIVSVVQQCVENCYANFVIQALVETSLNPAEFKRLSDRVRVVLPCSPYAAKIEAKLRTKAFAIGVTLPAAPVAQQQVAVSAVPQQQQTSSMSMPPRGGLRATTNVNVRPSGPVYTPTNGASVPQQQQPLAQMKDSSNHPTGNAAGGKVLGVRRPFVPANTDKENQQQHFPTAIKKGVPAELPKPEEVPTQFTPYNPSPFHKNRGTANASSGITNNNNTRRHPPQSVQRTH